MLEDIRRLLGELADLESEGAPATEDDFEEFEDASGVTLPPVVKNWLAEVNGIAAITGCFFGVGPESGARDIRDVYDLFPDWERKGWIPVADDGCGNYFVVIAEEDSEAVAFVDVHVSRDEVAYILASDILCFVLGQLRRARAARFKDEEFRNWPFDESKAGLFDPKLVEGRFAPLPWQE